MTMDRDLRDALRRTQAPDDLADRVLARLGAARAPVTARSGNIRGWLAAAAILLLSAGAGERYYTHQRQEAAAARAREELRIALQITSETLAIVQQKIAEPAREDSR